MEGREGLMDGGRRETRTIASASPQGAQCSHAHVLPLSLDSTLSGCLSSCLTTPLPDCPSCLSERTPGTCLQDARFGHRHKRAGTGEHVSVPAPCCCACLLLTVTIYTIHPRQSYTVHLRLHMLAGARNVPLLRHQ